MIYQLGCIPDEKDERDFLFAAHPLCKLEGLPEAVDMRPMMPPVYNQGQTSSCTGHASAGYVHYIDRINFVFDDPPSRLYPYYKAREIVGDEKQDCGAQIRNIVKAIADSGIPHENLWPFAPENVTRDPGFAADADAMLHQATAYHRVNCQSPDEVKAALASGSPVILGIPCFASGIMGEDASKFGLVRMPYPGEKNLGGHAILLCGYDSKRFIFRNSWGARWGAKGYGYLPIDYVTQYGHDAWVIDYMEPPQLSGNPG